MLEEEIVREEVLDWEPSQICYLSHGGDADPVVPMNLMPSLFTADDLASEALKIMAPFMVEDLNTIRKDSIGDRLYDLSVCDFEFFSKLITFALDMTWKYIRLMSRAEKAQALEKEVREQAVEAARSQRETLSQLRSIEDDLLRLINENRELCSNLTQRTKDTVEVYAAFNHLKKEMDGLRREADQAVKKRDAARIEAFDAVWQMNDTL